MFYAKIGKGERGERKVAVGYYAGGGFVVVAGQLPKVEDFEVELSDDINLAYLDAYQDNLIDLVRELAVDPDDFEEKLSQQGR